MSNVPAYASFGSSNNQNNNNNNNNASAPSYMTGLGSTPPAASTPATGTPSYMSFGTSGSATTTNPATSTPSYASFNQPSQPVQPSYQPPPSQPTYQPPASTAYATFSPATTSAHQPAASIYASTPVIVDE